MIDILLSDLAVDQLKGMPSNVGRQMLETLQRLRVFPDTISRIFGLSNFLASTVDAEFSNYGEFRES